MQGQVLFSCPPKYGVCVDIAKVSLRIDDAETNSNEDEEKLDDFGLQDDNDHQFDMVMSMVNADNKVEHMNTMIGML